MIHQRTVTSLTLNNTEQFLNGGYRVYWKLVSQFISMNKSFFTLHKNSSLWFKSKAFASILWTVFFTSLIKPLGQFYKYKTHIYGTCEIENHAFVKSKFALKKTKSHYLFGSLLIKHPSKITQAEKNKILENR